jgi:hypothetical protein
MAILFFSKRQSKKDDKIGKLRQRGISLSEHVIMLGKSCFLAGKAKNKA